jgi:hypothetical protein
MLAARALRATLGDGQEALAFPFTELFWKIGMTRTVPETDWEGNFILSSQVWTTSRDLARLGLLYLNDGMWNGERILPPGWGRYVSSHGPAQPPRDYGYGATFWTFPKDSGLPTDAYIARGNRGQNLVIIPSRQIVIVRRGFDGGESGFDLDAFSRAILNALSLSIRATRLPLSILRTRDNCIDRRRGSVHVTTAIRMVFTGRSQALSLVCRGFLARSPSSSSPTSSPARRNGRSPRSSTASRAQEAL